MGVSKHVDIEIELKESAHAVAIANDSSLHTNEVFRVSLDFNAVRSLVEHSEFASIRSILVDEGSVLVHESSNILHCVVSSDVVIIGVSSSVVINGGQVETLVSAWSWDLHSVQEGETTGVATGVRDEIFLFASLSGGVVVTVQSEKVFISGFSTSH